MRGNRSYRLCVCAIVPLKFASSQISPYQGNLSGPTAVGCSIGPLSNRMPGGWRADALYANIQRPPAHCVFGACVSTIERSFRRSIA